MGQFNHGAAKAGKKVDMWTDGSKYCESVNRRRDVRVVSSPYLIPPIRSLTQVIIAVEFDLDRELQRGTVSKSAFFRSV